MKFPVKQITIKVREQDCTIKELTQGERSEIAKKVTEDKFLATALFASYGCIEPKFTPDEAANMPAEVIAQIATAVMNLSGLGDKDKDTPAKNG